jgi:hypothetical protein
VIRRAATVALLGGLALALVDGGAASREQLPGPGRGTALCPRPAALRIEFGSWSEPRPESPHEFFAAVWTRGGRGTGGSDIYATVTSGESRISRLCRRIVQRGVSSVTKLRAALSYRMTASGNAYFVDSRGTVTPGSPHVRSINPLAERHASSVAFTCNVTQRVVVHTHPLERGGGQYLSVRTQPTRTLLALAILNRSGNSTFRSARSCQQD